jgi:hypothetical protein
MEGIFMEDNLNPVDAGQGGSVDAQSSVQDTGVQSGAAVQRPAQTPQENAAFAEMRRKLESYEPRVQKATEYETALQRAARVTGHESVEEFLKAVEAEEQRAKTQQFQQAGIQDPKIVESLIQKQLESNPVIKQTQTYFTQARIAQEKAALQGKKFFKELEKDIDAVLSKDPSLPVESVYNFLKGVKADELYENAAKAAAGQAVENHINQSKRGTESVDVPPATQATLDFTAAEKDWAERGVKRGTYKDLKEAWEWLRGKKKI